ncbi:alpha/beta fold hydrolase [Phenylobacterium kunshanense]|uniref:Alpha/beta hydrolase n=1 Tax=Phenylobacterium kunshanense TaxID=1445034 RepID=A0A328BNR5_9CAUL|nr:alpha/beta fold hydrolase [Phenylobacterium kunshanense]RAK68657.1 alpha/beta hydrolase [Phenylobacterium kunshanense]
MTARLVLLHSPLLGPLSWRPVAAALAAQGRAVEAPAWPRLSTLGEDCYAALANSMGATLAAGGPAIVVAHSGAGALIPSVAALAKGVLQGVIYCDAILPHPGLSWFDTAPPQLASQLRAGAEAGRLPSWDRWWPPGALERLIPDFVQRTALIDELEPIPVGYFEELAPELPLSVPAAYLQLSGAYIEEAQIAGRKGWPVVRLPLHHLAMLTHAEAVANAIQGLSMRLEPTDG